MQPLHFTHHAAIRFATRLVGWASDFKPVGSSLAFGNEARKISGLPVVHQTAQLPSASFHVNDDNVLKDEAPKVYSGDGLLTEEGQLGLAKQRKMAMDFQADA